MDVVQAGDEFYATMKRSTNGGGENSPVLEGEDDLYEMFLPAWKTEIWIPRRDPQSDEF